MESLTVFVNIKKKLGTHFGYFQHFLQNFTKTVALTSRLINVFQQNTIG